MWTVRNIVHAACRHTFRGSNRPLWAKPSVRPSSGRRNHWAKRLPSTLRGPLQCFAQIGVFYSTRCIPRDLPLLYLCLL